MLSENAREPTMNADDGGGCADRTGRVTKRYAAGGAAALNRVSLRVAAGEAVAVMGPSAAASPSC